jgi:hypothetical protein
VKAAKDEKLAEVETIGKQISSLVDKINREEDAGVEAWNKHAGESTSLREHLAEKLAEALPICKAAGMKVKDLKAKYIGDRLGDTQFKQILRVARGAITFQQIKKKERTKKRTQAAAKKVGNSRPIPQHTDTVVRGADGKPIDTSGFGGPAKEQLEAELARSAGPKPVGPGIPGIPEPVVEPKQGLDNVKSSPVPALVPALDLMPETLEQCLDRMMVKEAKSVVPAFTVCVQCIEYLVPFMNEGTRAQLRKDISAITNAADKRTRKAA